MNSVRKVLGAPAIPGSAPAQASTADAEDDLYGEPPTTARSPPARAPVSPPQAQPPVSAPVPAPVPARERRTGCVSELVLLPFYPVLQGLGVAPCDLNFLLDGLLVHVGHATLELPGGEGGVSRRARERMRRGRANPGGLAGSAAVGTG